MASKVTIFLGLFLATFILIASEVTARGLTETSDAVDTAKEVEKINEAALSDAKYPRDGYGGYPGGGYGRGGYDRGHRDYGRGRGGYCHYGCCGHSYYGRGCRCCTYANEKVDAEAQVKPHN